MPGGMGDVPPEKIKGARRELLQPAHEWAPEARLNRSKRGWGKRMGGGTPPNSPRQGDGVPLHPLFFPQPAHEGDP